MGIPFTERQINVWNCLTDPAKPCIAMIDGFPLIFRGETPLKARQFANDWRREAVQNDKLLTKAQKKLLLGEGAL